MDSGQPLVTVLTPVFNGERYLETCVESVLAQTYDNWEYIIADNHSTDGTSRIARRYEAMDARIRFHEGSEHLPVMKNWNRGLRQIGPDSKYCKIIHADDILMPECLSKMVSVAERHPSVGIVGAYRIDEDRVNLDHLPYPTDFVTGGEICRRRLTGGPDMFGSPSSILIRSDLIRRREKFYNEQNIHADTEVCFELLNDSDFGFVQQTLTYTRRHNESMTSFINTIHTKQVQQLVRLLKYGKSFLSDEEFRLHLARLEKSYYRFLGREAISGVVRKDRREKRKDFWAFHTHALSSVGYRISKPRLTFNMMLAVYRKALAVLDPVR
jgi:glycosyltransferase involved in cell wall biosynthesis